MFFSCQPNGSHEILGKAIYFRYTWQTRLAQRQFIYRKKMQYKDSFLILKVGGENTPWKAIKNECHFRTIH